MKALCVGCSGWMYDDWRGRLYPEREPKRRWLELYVEEFDTVEVNATLNRLPKRDAVAENFHRDDARLHAWLAALPGGLHALEFRHPSWFDPEILGATELGEWAQRIA